MLVLLAFLVLAQAMQSGPPSTTPSPMPTASPSPIIVIAPEFTLYDFGANDVAYPNADVGSALLNVTANAGNLHATATAGAYSFPVAGFPLLPDNAPGANVMLYSPLPVAALTYDFNSHLSVAAGKFAALLGQESPFTYQNINVQRGIAWSMEPTISRGIQLAYTNGPWSTVLQENDAYYSGANRAFEGLISWSASANTNLQFAAIITGANVPPNPTTTVGNKAEYDLMYTRTIGRLELLPYFLWVHSPASNALGYARANDATAAVVLAAWTFSPQWSAAFRYEAARNASSSSDMSANADLVGFGAGSSASSETLTPTYHLGNGGVLRLEYSHVSATGLTQDRYGLEFGVMH